MKIARTLGWQASSSIPTLCLTAVTLLGTSAVYAATPNTIDVQAIRQAVQTRGATWKVGENWLTQLSIPELKKMMGVKDATLGQASKFSVPSSKKANVPTALDWRSNNGVNWVSPILNQGNCGSCVAFATVGTLETQYNVSAGIPGLNPEFSAQALFMCGGASCDTGWEPGDAADYLKSTGVPDEACAPYTLGATGVDVACSTVCSDSAARSTKIADYTTPTSYGADIDAVKAALQNGPLVTTLSVYADFITYTSGVYKHVTGDMLGGHAVSIVGYDDGAQAWICRNSWGPDWGENGFFRVAYTDTSGVSDNTWGFTMAKPDGYVFLESPTHKAYVSGSVGMLAKSTFANTSGVDFSILDDAGKTLKASTCGSLSTTGDCAQALDTTQLKDGVHEVVATAKYGSGLTTASQHELIYVLNGTATGSLSFTGDGGLDLTKPLTDRVVFDIVAPSSPVPYSQLEFDVWDGATGKTLVYHNIAQIVVAQGMTLGWRTPMVPNGNYQISFTGTISVPGKPDFTVSTAKVAVSVANPATATVASLR